MRRAASPALSRNTGTNSRFCREGWQDALDLLLEPGGARLAGEGELRHAASAERPLEVMST